jgi:hypothetical protein
MNEGRFSLHPCDGEYRIGAKVPGRRFDKVSIELAPAMLADPRVIEWVRNDVMPRLASSSSTIMLTVQ